MATSDDLYFGQTVSLSSNGSRLAIGHPWGKVNTDSGVSVFELSSGGVWELMGAVIRGPANDERTGSSVSLSANGTRLAVGAPRYYAKGHVRVYEWSNSAWTQLGEDVPAETVGDSFGECVELSADGARFVAGARYNSEAGEYNGHVRVFEWSGDGWTQLGADLDGAASGGAFGTGVAISGDGRRVAGGGPKADWAPGPDSGYAQAFELAFEVLTTPSPTPSEAPAATAGPEPTEAEPSEATTLTTTTTAMAVLVIALMALA